MKHLTLAIWIGLTVPTVLWGQTFNRVETAVGFGDLGDNTGVAVADYDQDGDLDVFVVAKQDWDVADPTTQSRLFRNTGSGRFEDVTQEAGFVGLHNYDDSDPGWGYGVKMGASWGDFDNDGFPDLFLSNYLHNQLFRNQGDGTFVEITQSAGLVATDSAYHTTSLWWDYDQDGWLDLFVGTWGDDSPDKLYHNEGDGTFSLVTQQVGMDQPSETWMAMPIDANEDGRWDLFVARDFGPDALYIQQMDGSFLNLAGAFGANSDGNEMGMAISDVNLDGELDVFISNISDNRMLIRQSSGQYEDQALQMGVLSSFWAWGTRFGDFDLDGDEDLFVANGYERDQIFFSRLKTNFLFENQHAQGMNSFLDISQQARVAVFSNSMGMETFDYDWDGDLDVIVTSTDAGILFHENEVSNVGNPFAQSWVYVDLEGTVSNRDAIGSRVEVFAQGEQFTRFYTGAGFLSQSQQPIHICLGSATAIDSMVIYWPNGTMESHQNLPIHKCLKIIEGTGVQTIDLQPAAKVAGCMDPQSCSYNPEAVIDDGSCTYLPAGTISGPSLAGFVETVEYQYPGATESRFHWEVSHGEIIKGQGTSTITIKWGIADSGRVSVREIGDCYSPMAELGVNLTLQETPEDIGIARLWNEALLEAIRKDFARPTVHARNLYHTAIAMYDAWAIFDDEAETYLLGKTVGGFETPYTGFVTDISKEEARDEVLSFAVYRLLSHRFFYSPGAVESIDRFDLLMRELNYNSGIVTTDYDTGLPAAMGNYLGEKLIEFGLQDGAREETFYDNGHYQPVNTPLVINESGNPILEDPNRWQPLAFDVFIDQAGIPIPGQVIPFLSPEWGEVMPFALDGTQAEGYLRSGNSYWVYHDPGKPPYLDANAPETSEQYKWGFSLVSHWGAHLDPFDGVMWDISPGGIGNLNIDDFPKDFADYPDFYQPAGGDPGNGYDLNPHTGQPYEPQMVPRGDYARVLAEFWADGPDSETPPGHWFTILNTVSDHPLTEKKFNGEGPALEPIEWEVKTYFTLAGAMHDAAIAAWSVKGWYDYIRPVSAIRYMAELGQSSDPSAGRYHPQGIPLVPGLVEMVDAGDELAGAKGQHVGKIKLYSWKGHRFIRDPEVDQAGSGWILAEDWMPYQRPSFVTPPFAGYVSGHSTYSRAAAEVMTLMTGDPYFPGGMGEFVAPKDAFLVFEEGPSQDVVLQWATYRDASDQCSLSRIWGGIHPPADDIPGRFIGEQVGIEAYNLATRYFDGTANFVPGQLPETELYPNPVNRGERIIVRNVLPSESFQLLDVQGREIDFDRVEYHQETRTATLDLDPIEAGIYFVRFGESVWKVLVQ
ncbi:FG-GAP-like repeat-containing protein [Pontibacter sp. G13]|uniref:FG-GAP-like repeat-containing protein n=1 Tax=Pontibacter sp. G13 TaxID=3074898 RepID=UPI00288A47BA|nr:FG-GAP-like repeat-containing protein [Pontibacter sp. G13]WNJ19082.1 FG-GAP-like repeat-containing protein [Pontibacter sp. G13]